MQAEIFFNFRPLVLQARNADDDLFNKIIFIGAALLILLFVIRIIRSIKLKGLTNNYFVDKILVPTLVAVLAGIILFFLFGNK